MNKNIKILLVASLILNLVLLFFIFDLRQKNNVATTINSVPEENISLESEINTNQLAYLIYKQIDLNSDGQSEDVTLKISHPYRSARLLINDKTIDVPGEYASGRLEFVDFDINDNDFWVAVPTDGPSDDPSMAFYGWDGKDIINYGVIDGRVDTATIPRNKTITAIVRGKVLQTWSHAADFVLNKENKLIEKPRKFYDVYQGDERNHWEQKLTALVSLDLVKSPLDKTVSFKLKKGDVVRFAGCDDISWCVVENSEKVRGWFELSKDQYSFVISVNKEAREVFDGLSFAD